MFYWGLQYGMFVEILEPEELRDKEINALREIQKIYCIMNP
jgi:predicted DNA-binding transcriptional regulator YafY